MSLKQTAKAVLMQDRKFLSKILEQFTEADAGYSPAEGMMTVAQQVRHIAHTYTWFRHGGFGAGFDMDFEPMLRFFAEPISLAQGLSELNEAFDSYIAFIDTLSEQALAGRLPDNPILGPLPVMALFHAQTDHTAHHRGALTVYLRLLGRVPNMPYAE